MEAPYRRLIARSLLERIRAWLDQIKDDPLLPDDDEDDGAALPADYAALGAAHVMFMRSLLMGMEAAAGEKKRRGGNFADVLLPGMPAEALPFEEAIAFLQTQIPLTKDAYYALDDKLRLRAFTVGRLGDADAVNRVKGIIRHGLERGGTIGDFYRMTDDEILDGAGFGKGNMSYWETVYRTNQDALHNAGRAMGFEAEPPEALELLGVSDERQTEICRTLTNPPFIRPYNDPVWKKLWPPFHFSCRTYVRGIYDRAELEAYGGAEAAYKQGTHAAPAEGFGAYPLDRESYWRLTPEMAERAKRYGIDGEIAAAAVRLGMPQYAEELIGEGIETLYPAGGGKFDPREAGGYVIKASSARPGERNRRDAAGHIVETDELGLAVRAAEAGHQILFMPADRRRGTKSRGPDILIDGQVGEIKHIFSRGKETIEEAVSAARKQGASFVLMEITDEIAGAYSEAEIRRQVEARLRNNRRLRQALVFWKGKFLPLFTKK
jgi:hypothetical protein